MLKQTQRLQILLQALKEKAPQTYRELRSAGKVDTFLKERDARMMESYYHAYGEAYYRFLREGPEEGITDQALAQVRAEKLKDALAAYSEFKDLAA